MSPWISADIARRQPAVLEIGREILARSAGSLPSLFDVRRWEGRLLDLAMRDDALRTALFRLVDVLPMLSSAAEVTRHVQEYLGPHEAALPLAAALALRVARGGILAGVAGLGIRSLAARMGERFIAGSSIAEAMPELRRLHSRGLAFSADLLGEATVSDAEAAAYAGRYEALIGALAEETARWPAKEVPQGPGRAPLPASSISLKISSLSAHLDPVDSSGCVARLLERVLPLFLQARERNVRVTLDMEQWELHGIAWDLFEELAAHPRLRSWPHIGIVLQAYLSAARRDVERLLSIARSRGSPLSVRLVKGAYWDFEVAHARQHGYPCPVFLEKARTDAQFEELSALLLESIPDVYPGIGSHNVRSLAHALAAARLAHVPAEAFELEMLYGMAEPTREALRQMGHRVRIYSPIGELLPGIAYLVRRLLENTANSGFLRSAYREGVDAERLLAPPAPPVPPGSRAPSVPPGEKTGPGKAAAGTALRGLSAPFVNCPHADFTDPAVRTLFGKAVSERGSALPVRIPVSISGRRSYDGEQLVHPCPARRDRPATQLTLAGTAEAERAVQEASGAWPAWRDRPLAERAQLLETLARRLEADRFALAALQCFEVGKPWRESDADVAEAVDYCRYYARQAVTELAARSPAQMSGEDNLVAYQGRGVAAVIAPWNFPMAILCGMTAASLVAGNTVIMKPAEQSSAIAYRLYEHMLGAGVPARVLHFLPGRGEVAGQHLVAHPGVAMIAFTGSRAVGLSILAQAGRAAPGQHEVKRVVCEMGGKNAIIVDDDADLDEAVAGVIRSAFGYAGQKCSACSRLITVGGVSGAFTTRLIAACRSLVIAPPEEPRCELGPVIDAEAYERLMAVMADPGAEPLFVGKAPGEGFFVPPAIFRVTDLRHRLMQEELFGPILALFEAADFEAALEAAGSTDYALTGGVYSRSPAHLAEARRRFRVGNLYLNRPCTGAMVGRQPFGGFGLSGAGTKAGGAGYLLNFANPSVVCENTMRSGFIPEGS
jgi:RHH-type proline utilization regulon transcriptional repressor/proline dehydrogenase/delta 1-pyrroline-5-carboxylate dehydrogenase